MRSLFLAVAVLLTTPVSALAAGELKVSINGAGKVTGSGIDCSRAPGVSASGDCTAAVAGDQATITATPAEGFAFKGWSGACTSTEADCTLAMTGNQSTTATFLDVQDPVVTLESPGRFVSGTVPVTAAVTDNGVIDKVQLTAYGVPVIKTAPPYTHPFLSKLVPDGPVKVSAAAMDRAKNVTTVETEVLVDNTLPSLEVSGPDREPFPPGSIQTWTLAATDGGSGVEATRCSVVPLGEDPVLVPCSGAAEHSVSGLAVGRYTFTFKAKDRAGNIATVTRNFRIETPEQPVLESLLLPAAVGAGGGVPGAAAAPTELEDPDPPQIRVALGFRYVSGVRFTKLSHFIVRGVPAGATVTVRCPSGCARKEYSKTVKRFGRVSLKPLVKRSLKAGTTVTVTVSRPGSSSAVKVLEIRRRKAPLVTTQCQPEGAADPVAC